MKKSRKFNCIGLVGLAYLISAPFMLKQLYDNRTTGNVSADLELTDESVPEEETSIETTEDTLPEETDTAVSPESFCAAMEAIKANQNVTRKSWDNPDVYLLLSVPEVKNSTDAEVMPYIAMKTADNKLIPWLASQEDLLAEDWIILN